MDSADIRVVISVLLPVAPAYVCFKTLRCRALVKGPLKKWSLDLGGAFAGYQRQRYAITIAPGPIHDVPPIVLKPYVSAFRDGVKAVDSGNWQAAAQSMREAINLQAGADEMVKQVRIHGMRLEPYAPHYYLARALTEMGECVGAAKALAQAELEIKGTGLESRLQALRAKCTGSR